MRRRPSHLRFFLGNLKPYAWPAAVVFLCEVSVTLLTMIIPLFSVVIFDYAYPERDLSIFTLLILLGFLFYLIEFFLNIHIDYLNIYMSENMKYRLTLQTFEKAQNLPLRFHSKMRKGDLTVRLTDDIPTVCANIVQFLPRLVIPLAKLGIFFGIALTFDPTITLLALLSLPLYLLETKFFSDKLAHIREEEQQNDSLIVDGIASRLTNIRTIKVCNRQREEAEKLGLHVRRSFYISLRESLVSVIHLFTNSVTIRVWGVFVLWYMGYEVIQGHLSIGQVIALGIYLPLLEDPIHNLASLYQETQVALVSMKRVRSVLDERAETTEKGEKKTLEIRKGELVFKNISFGYKASRPVINNFNLTVQPNSTVAFVGESGAGKSTLLNLLIRFFTPDTGKILIDGEDIAQVNLESLRNQLGIVFQEPSIMEGTVRENIAYDSKNKTEAEIESAAKKASAHDFILSLPQGYDTPLSAFGAELSGGQRQRIAIARILLKDPKILIFDEATGALDAESEFLIQEAIQGCRGKKTVLIVAHRFSTIKNVDRIIVLDRGKIAEEGTFNELLQKQGLFFRLYNMQLGGFQKFLRMFQIELQRTLRYKQNLTLVMGRVEQYETLLKNKDSNAVAKWMEEVRLRIQKHLRTIDFSSVYYGGRIVIALPETDARGAEQCLKRIVSKAGENPICTDAVRIKTDIMFGFVSIKEAGLGEGEDPFEPAHYALEEACKSMPIVDFLETEERE